MQAIRIPDDHWGKVWRALIAAGPLSGVGPPAIYLVNDRALRTLRRQELPFENVSLAHGLKAGRNDALPLLALSV
jgi:hypothetical protein